MEDIKLRFSKIEKQAKNFSKEPKNFRVKNKIFLLEDLMVQQIFIKSALMVLLAFLYLESLKNLAILLSAIQVQSECLATKHMKCEIKKSKI